MPDQKKWEGGASCLELDCAASTRLCGVPERSVLIVSLDVWAVLLTISICMYTYRKNKHPHTYYIYIYIIIYTYMCVHMYI